MIKINDYLVKIECTLEREECALEDEECSSGSGVLFPMPGCEYDYVITALHCIKGKEFKKNYEEIKITYKSEGLNVIDVIADKSYFEVEGSRVILDFAIIKVSKINILDTIYISKQKENSNIIFSAYPSSKEGEILSCVEGKVRNYRTIDFYIQVTDNRMNTMRELEISMGGASGSGVFQISGNSIKLIGILTNVQSVENIHNELIVLDINKINKYLEDHHDLTALDEIENQKFENYLDVAFKEFSNDCEGSKRFLKKISKRLSSFELKKIVEDIDEEIFFPVGEGSTRDGNVWKGWLELLTYMIIRMNKDFYDHVTKKFKVDEFFSEFKECNNIKFIYSDIDSLGSLVKKVCFDQEFFDKLNLETKIILNSKRSDKIGNKKIDNKKFVKIIKNCTIDSEDEDDYMVNNISSPSVNKNLSFAHLDYFNEEIASKTEFEKDREHIEDTIKKILNEEISIDEI